MGGKNAERLARGRLFQDLKDSLDLGETGQDKEDSGKKQQPASELA